MPISEISRDEKTTGMEAPPNASSRRASLATTRTLITAPLPASLPVLDEFPIR